MAWGRPFRYVPISRASNFLFHSRKILDIDKALYNNCLNQNIYDIVFDAENRVGYLLAVFGQAIFFTAIFTYIFRMFRVYYVGRGELISCGGGDLSY